MGRTAGNGFESGTAYVADGLRAMSVTIVDDAHSRYVTASKLYNIFTLRFSETGFPPPTGRFDPRDSAPVDRTGVARTCTAINGCGPCSANEAGTAYVHPALLQRQFVTDCDPCIP